MDGKMAIRIELNLKEVIVNFNQILFLHNKNYVELKCFKIVFNSLIISIYCSNLQYNNPNI